MNGMMGWEIWGINCNDGLGDCGYKSNGGLKMLDIWKKCNE